jgi:hypothetical protein
MQLAPDQRRNRAELVTQRDQANKALADLKIEKAKVDGDRRVVEADLGPVRCLATLLRAGDQDVLRYFILVVAVLLDPAHRGCEGSLQSPNAPPWNKARRSSDFTVFPIWGGPATLPRVAISAARRRTRRRRLSAPAR